MPLTPGESDRLLLHLQASLAQRRRERGLLLNVPEATALIADAICEWARDGLTMREVRERAGALLTQADVLPGVADALGDVRVEARFDDGTRLVVVKSPLGTVAATPQSDDGVAEAVGTLTIENHADTAIGVTSHIHLAEVNPRLRLDRAAAFGMRLAIPAGASVWLRPGDAVSVPIRPIAGDRVAVGTTGTVEGRLDDPGVRERALAALRSCGYLDIVDGVPVGDAVAADQAVQRLMRARREAQA